MNTIKIIKEYVDANLAQYEAETSLSKSVSLFNRDNYFIGVSTIITDAYSNLLKQLIGGKNFDWIDWWMWECNFGKKPNTLFWVNDKKYDASGMTLEKFWGIVKHD